MTFPREFCPSGAAEFPNDNPALHAGATWLCLEIGGPIRAVIRPAARKTGAPPAVPAREAARVSDREEAPPALEASTESVREAAPEAEARSADRRREAPSTSLGGGASEYFLDDLALGWPELGWPEEGFPESVAGIIEQWLTAPAQDEPICEAALPANEDIAEASGAVTDPVEVTVGDLDESTYDGANEDASAALSAFIGALVGSALAAGSTRAAAVIPALVGEGRVDGGLLDDTMCGSLLSSGIAERRGASLYVTGAARATLDAWRDVLQDRSTDLSACGTTTLDVWGAELLVALGAPRSCAELRKELRRRGVAAFGMLLAA